MGSAYLGQNTEGTGHADLADTDDGDLVARRGHRFGNFHHQLRLERHLGLVWLELGTKKTGMISFRGHFEGTPLEQG